MSDCQLLKKLEIRKLTLQNDHVVDDATVCYSPDSCCIAPRVFL